MSDHQKIKHCPECERLRNLLNHIQFRNIVTWQKNTGRRVAIIWFVKQLQGGTLKEAKEYVDGCHVGTDGVCLREVFPKKERSGGDHAVNTNKRD